MELEIKHLAPYLPYGLKMQTITGSNVDGDRHVKTHNLTPTFLVTCLSDDIYRRISCKPILRPMSDLDKHGLAGEDNWSLLSLLNKRLPEEYNIDGELDFELESLPYRSSQYLNAKHSLVVYEFLFEHHFDVFGLIGAGLAVDINTLS